MSVSTVITVKTDPQVKQQAQKIVKDFGLSLSGVINGYLKQLIRDKEIHFTLENPLNKKTEKDLAQIESDITNFQNLDGPYSAQNITKAFQK